MDKNKIIDILVKYAKWSEEHGHNVLFDILFSKAALEIVSLKSETEKVLPDIETRLKSILTDLEFGTIDKYMAFDLIMTLFSHDN